MSHFEFFGLPVAFRLDEAALRRSFLQRSKQYHPDFHTLADDAQQAEMLDLATRTNEAYRVLNDPDQRIRYVLELNGLIGDESNQPALPPDFLMEVMGINESLMELEFDFDQQRYDTTLAGIDALENELVSGIQPVLDSWTADSGEPSALLAVRDYFLKLRYLRRIRENLSKFAPA